MPKKITQEEFIKRAKEKYGEKYIYDKVIYINSKTPVTIICPKHGEFKQRPSHFLKGVACKKCGYRIISQKLAMSKEEFIAKATEKHSGYYNYDKVDYINAKTPVTIICPNHGEFQQIPDNHLKGHGCNKCSGKSKKSTEKFINEAKKVHKNKDGSPKYIYDKVNYINAKTPVTIICPNHGEFKQAPINHLHKNGCPICNRGWTKKITLDYISKYDLESLDVHQLLELIAEDYLPKAFKTLITTKANSKERKSALKKLKEEYGDDSLSEDEIDDRANKEIEKIEKDLQSKETLDLISEDEDSEKLPELIEKEIELDNQFLKNLTSIGDRERSIIEMEIQKIWRCYFTYNNLDWLSKYLSIDDNDSLWMKELKNTFINEYEGVVGIEKDNEYAFPYEPTLMQKLIVYRLREKQFYCNWCGTGAGKTNSALLFSRLNNCKLSVIILPNGVISTMQNSIKAIYPNSNIIVFDSFDEIREYDKSKYNYILINYEKFQINDIYAKIKKIAQLNVIDFVCIDEVHNSKLRDNNVKCRYGNIMEFMAIARTKNKSLYVLGMTATPLINNISEVRSILELVTGKSYSEMDNKISIDMIHKSYKYLILNGFRYIPNFGIKTNVEVMPIKGDDSILPKLIKLRNNNADRIEDLLLDAKLNFLSDKLKPNSIIYTHYHSDNKMLNKIKNLLTKLGYSFEFYCGGNDSDREDGLKKFLKHKVDFLIASSPITTGIDGLQKATNRMYILSLPWTSALYQQLLGRINRQGSNFKLVEVYIPCVEYMLSDNSIWSWDKSRYNIITYKKTLSDAVVDGNFTQHFMVDKAALMRQAIESLKNGINDSIFNRKNINIEIADDVIEKVNKETKHRNYESCILDVHKKVHRMKSSDLFKYFSDNPNEWLTYHSARDKRISKWLYNPIEDIANYINEIENDNLIVADLGCGRNVLKGLVNQNKISKWYSVDLYSDDETVIKSDMGNVSKYIEPNSIDVAVYCLSFWGCVENFNTYLNECHKILKSNGVAIVVIPNDDESIMHIQKYAFENKLIFEKIFPKKEFNFFYLRKF